MAHVSPAIRNGELVGGCDIVIEMYKSGELDNFVRGR
jgi:glutaredoxin-related protein